MTKRTLIGALAVALVLISAGCKSTTNNGKPEKPTVTTEATNGGATLHLSWSDVEGATSYEITAGDSVYTATSASFDVSTPAATIEVRAVNGSKKSDPASIDCKIVESTVDIFGDLDTTHVNGFGFGSDGSATGYKLYYTYLANMDFYAQISHGAMTLVSAQGVNQDRKGNELKAASVAYDSIGIAAPLDSSYIKSSLTITADSAYYLRISGDTSATWDANDHFAKANVVSIDSAKVALKLGYQKVAGIRWLTK